MSHRPDIVRKSDTDDPEVKDLLDLAETSWYGDAAFFGAMARSPEIFKHLVATFETFGHGNNLTPELLELTRLKIAEIHQCAYCATVRTLDVREQVKSKEDAIFGSIEEEGITRREYLAVVLAKELCEDPHRIEDELFEDLQEVFTEQEIIELLLFASLEVGLDRFCIALEVQPTDDSAYPDTVEYPMENPRPQTE